MSTRDALRDMVQAIERGAINIDSPAITAGGGEKWPWHEEWLHHARGALAADEKGESELMAALQSVTDHFADVMSGPLISSHVKFANGVEGIPTIANARAILAKHAPKE